MTDDPPPRPRRSSSLSSAFLARVALIELTACGQKEGSGLERVQRAGVLRWGADAQGGEPYAMEDPDHPGQYRGFEVELADALARELGVRAEFVQNDWSSLIPTLEPRLVRRRPERHRSHSRPRRPRPLHAPVLPLPAPAHGARRATPASPASTSLRGLPRGHALELPGLGAAPRTGAQAVPYEGVEEPYIDLEQGRLDAVLMDDIIAQRYGDAAPRPARGGRRAPRATTPSPCAPARMTCARRSTTRWAASPRSGELRAILRRWNIDNAAEQRMVEWTEAQSRELLLADLHRPHGLEPGRRSSSRARSSRCSCPWAPWCSPFRWA